MPKRAAEMQKSIIDALPAHLAVLDSRGYILTVNKAWRHFCTANDSHHPDFYIGENYLDVCNSAVGNCSAEGSIVENGIRDVLSGRKDIYTVEYPCHSRDERRWFRLMVTPLGANPGSGVVVMHLNVTDRVLAEETLNAREFQQRLLARSLQEEARRLSESQAVAEVGSWETDLATLRVRWSEETYRILGILPTQLAPSHAAFVQCVHPDDRSAVDDAFFKSLNNEGVFSIEHRVGNEGDAVKHVEERWYIHRDEHGHAVRAVGTCQDITERKNSEIAVMSLNSELEERVRTRTQQLEAVNKELSAFSYSVAHDLRSPLATINGFSQLLLKSDGDQLSDKGKHYLHRIRAGSAGMSELIDGLLSMTQISRQVMNTENVDLTKLSRRFVRQLRDSEPARVADVNIHSGLVAHGDPAMMAIVMQNLISNAWKYSSKSSHGQIDIGSESLGNGEVCFFVRDNGAGFDMANANKLFQVFERLHKDSEFPGTGIGLATVKRAVERQGGRIWAESSPGHGATFRFTVGSGDKSQGD